MSPSASEADIRAAVATALGRPVETLTPVRGGRNSQMFRATAGGVAYAVKRYPPQSAEHPDRLATEYTALAFLRAAGIDSVPAPVARDAERRLGVYEWIEGRALKADERPLDALAAFFLRLQDLRSTPAAAEIGNASAACLSEADTIAWLRRRRARLRAVESGSAALRGFLARFDQVAGALDAGRRAEPLAPRLRCLSASDFGFHNALVGADGRLRLVDFEYFGWDDPVKAVADVMLHPGMSLSEAEATRYCGAVSAFCAAEDPDFAARFARLFPIYGLIWCMIVLNAFLGDYAAHRRATGFDVASPESLDRQLAIAESLLARVTKRRALEQVHAS